LTTPNHALNIHEVCRQKKRSDKKEHPCQVVCIDVPEFFRFCPFSSPLLATGAGEPAFRVACGWSKQGQYRILMPAFSLRYPAIHFLDDYSPKSSNLSGGFEFC
jgi:hypothetical protein